MQQFVENCSMWEGLQLDKFMEDCLHWEGPQAGAGKEHEVKVAAQTICDELNAILIPHHPVLMRGRRQRNWE